MARQAPRVVPLGSWWGPHHAEVLDRLAIHHRMGKNRWRVTEDLVLQGFNDPAANRSRWRLRPLRAESPQLPDPWLYDTLPGALERYVHDRFHAEEVPLLWLGRDNAYWFLPAPMAALCVPLATYGEVQQGSHSRETMTSRGVLLALRWLSEQPLRDLERLGTIGRLGKGEPGVRATLQAMVAAGMPGAVWHTILHRLASNR